MSEVQSEAPEQSVETSSESTIESLAAEFPSDAPAAEPQNAVAQPASQPTPQYQAPDPLNEQQWNDYVQQRSQRETALQSQLQALNSTVQQVQLRDYQRRVEADIKDAVTKINEVANLTPELVEVALEMKTRKDPNLQRIWNNRDKNPEAFNKALKVVGNQLKAEYTVREDPQLAENQRAVKNAQRAMATTSGGGNSLDERMASMSPEERAVEWSKLVSSA